MKIPKKVTLHGITYTVIFDDRLRDKKDYIGEARLRDLEIRLQKNNDGFATPPQRLEQIFFHELVHVILHHMANEDLKLDEVFVEQFSLLLHQAITKAEY